MKRISAGTFSNSLREYLRAAGYFQKELADELGLHSKVLSRKLSSNGSAHLTEQDVKNIITILAQWQAITTQDQALLLLEQAQLQSAIFSEQEWLTPPLSQLSGNALLKQTPTAHILTRPLQHNLPAPLTRLIGRQEEVQQLCQLLGQDDIRLVTLVGPGGCGKTRLALHVARQLVDTFTHGVWFVDLTAERDATLVPQNIMQVLNITATLAPSALQSLTMYLQNKQMLLVLDNFEQVEAAAAVVGELLAAAPGLKVLVASRVVLRLYGETEFNVSPLDVPDSTDISNTTQLQQYSAVQLFIERARAVLRGFTLTPKNASSIAQICVKLDGLPLALELAAARVKALPLSQLLELLSAAPFSVLTGGARNLPGRHHTLHDTISWSYNLLSPTEQAWFARLGVFSGGWSLEAVATMIQAIGSVQYQDQTQGDTSSTACAVDLLERLVDNSLLVRLPVTADQVRFTLLETLREYALELLNAQGECERLRDWHACYYLTMAEAAEIGLRGSQQLVWRSRLIAERDNFRAALKWSLQRARAGACMNISDPDYLQHASTSKNTGTDHTSMTVAIPPEKIPSTTLPAVAVSQRLAAALRPYWEWQGYLFEGRRWLDAVLALPLPQYAGKDVLAARGKALSEAARLVCLQNEQDASVALAEESIAIWRQLDDPQGLASALLYRGWPAIAQGDNELAKSVYEQGLQLLSPTDNIWLRAQLLFYMGAAEGFTFHFAQMRSYYAQSRALFEQIGDKSALADVIKDQGGMAILEGNYSEAISNLLLSIELSHALGYKQYVATAMGSLGFAVGLRGEPDPQTASLQTAQIWGAKDGLMGAIGSSSWLQSTPFVQEIIRQIETRVNEASWRAARLAGQKLTEEQAIAFCMKLQP